jgi:hypothetical protein
MIGAPFSLTNQTLTRCFTTVLDLKGSSKHTNSENRSKQNHSQGIRIFIETLNMLRLVTEEGFSQIKHQKSRQSLQGRKHGKGKLTIPEQDYNSSLPEPPAWKGRPYGIVLHLTSTDLAYAYAKAKDFAAALYYAELFADNRLGGSGCIFERLNSINVVQSSLSGFGIPIEGNSHIGGSRCLNKSDLAVDFHHILELCFSELHEDEVLAGLEEQTSSIRFERPECFNEGIPQFERIESRTGIITGLMGLDARTQLKNRAHVSSDRLAISTGLKQLGLRDVSLHYLAGAHASGAFRSVEDHNKLEDQWAEESWRLLQWDDSLLMQTQQTSQEPHDNVGLSSFRVSNTMPGFHASFRNTISSLLEEDFSSFRINLQSTRSSLLGKFHRNIGQSAPIVELNSYALKSCSINQLEDLCDAFKDGDNMSASSWVAKHCATMDFVTRTHDETKFSDLECAMVAHEIFLKILHKKFGESSTDLIGNKISSHLWTFCSIARERDRPDIASSALERLKHFSKMSTAELEHDDTKSTLLPLRYSFEEAKILQCDGNTAAAVRACKEIMRRLKGSPPTKKNIVAHYVLVIETSLQCAEWLIGYPIESNNMIEKDLLAPAASWAKQLLKKKLVDRSLVSSTNFALGNFVADLYDSIQKRVNSHEWKVLGQAAMGRQKQKEKLEIFIKEKMSRKDFSNTRENPDRELQNALGQQRALQKEVDMDTNERNEVEASVFSYLNLAIDSYGIALSHCSCNTSTSSEVVFRFISLWFKNSNIEDRGIHEKIMPLLAEIPR